MPQQTDQEAYHELQESLHEDTREATVLQGTEDAAAAKEKEDAAAAKAAKTLQRGTNQRCHELEPTKKRQKQTHSKMKGQHTQGFGERRQRHDGDEEIEALIEGRRNTDKKDKKHRTKSTKGSSNLSETTKGAKRHERVQRILEEISWV